jgi:hypothetical protein
MLRAKNSNRIVINSIFKEIPIDAVDLNKVMEDLRLLRLDYDWETKLTEKVYFDEYFIQNNRLFVPKYYKPPFVKPVTELDYPIVFPTYKHRPCTIKLRDDQHAAWDKFKDAKCGLLKLGCGRGKCVDINTTFVRTTSGIYQAGQLIPNKKILDPGQVFRLNSPQKFYGEFKGELNTATHGVYVGKKPGSRIHLTNYFSLSGDKSHEIFTMNIDTGEMRFVPIGKVKLNEYAAVRHGFDTLPITDPKFGPLPIDKNFILFHVLCLLNKKIILDSRTKFKPAFKKWLSANIKRLVVYKVYDDVPFLPDYLRWCNAEVIKMFMAFYTIFGLAYRSNGKEVKYWLRSPSSKFSLKLKQLFTILGVPLKCGKGFNFMPQFYMSDDLKDYLPVLSKVCGAFKLNTEKIKRFRTECGSILQKYKSTSDRIDYTNFNDFKIRGLQKYICNGYSFYKVKKRFNVEVDLVDFRCDPKHYYLANGLLSHNSVLTIRKLQMYNPSTQIIIVPDDTLVGQWIEEMLLLGFVKDKSEIGIIKGAKEIVKPITIGSLDTVALRFKRNPWWRYYFRYAVFDEGHESYGMLRRKFSLAMFAGHRLWLTATDHRFDQAHKLIYLHNGPLIYQDLTTRLNPTVFFIDVKYTLSEEWKKNDEVLISYLSNTDKHWNQYSIEIINRCLRDGRTVLAMCPRVNQVQQIYNAVECESKSFIDGSVKFSDRTELAKARAVIAQWTTVKKGLDRKDKKNVGDFDTLIYPIPIKFGSEQLRQMAGRILRYDEGVEKKEPKVFIFYSSGITILNDRASILKKHCRKLGYVIKDIEY